MTDLDDAVARHLEDQPAVTVPPLAVIRRRADRRRRRLAGQWALVAAAGALAAASVVPAFVGDVEPDTVAAPVPAGAMVPPGVGRGEACPASPYNGGPRHCGYSSHTPSVRALVELVNTDRPPAGLSGCRPGDRATPNVRLRFVDDDGGVTAVRVVDCLLTADGDAGRRPVYAPEVAHAAARWLTGWALPADGSDEEGCDAVVEDLAALVAQISPDGGLTPQGNLLAQVAEGTIAEERPYLSAEHQAVADRVRPQLNSLILGVRPAPARTVREGLGELQAGCR